MFSWTPFPLIRISIAFCSGILFQIYNPEILNLNLLVPAMVINLGLVVAFQPLKTRYAIAKYLQGVASLILILLSGCASVIVKTDTNKVNHIIHVRDSVLAYKATLTDHLHEKKNSFKTTATINSIKTLQGWKGASGKVNLYIDKAGFNEDLLWGDEIIILGSPVETSSPSNPHEFDYKRFLSFRNIYHQHYVRDGDWVKTGNMEKDFFRYSAIARNYFTEIIKKYVHGRLEQAVSLALVIGVTDGIDNDLISAYSASGAMHVLAVSGLHLGIIYGLIIFLLKPMQKTNRGKWFVSLISITILWGYAFVTGLSPSVLRAVTMFSFVAVAQPLNRSTNIFNSLAGSAFILLLFDPYLIMSVGFQLSYLAVLGIIWIHRPLYLLFEAPNRVVDWVWSISCVSIAAQATTFSLGLLYFHQFPTYFLVSNLVVIPVSTAVLIVGIVLVVISFSTILASGVGWILEKLSWILNESVFITEDLPLSLISNIYIDVFQSWIILGILTTIIFVFQLKQIRWLYLAFPLSCVLAWTTWSRTLNRLEAKHLIVYNVTNSLAFEIFEKGQSHFFADSALLADKEKIRFHISGNRLFNLVSRTKNNMINLKSDSIQLISFSDNSILILNHLVKDLTRIKNADIIIVGKNALRSVPEVCIQFPQATVILDGSCKKYNMKFLRTALTASILERVHFVSVEGAFEKEF